MRLSVLPVVGIVCPTEIIRNVLVSEDTPLPLLSDGVTFI